MGHEPTYDAPKPPRTRRKAPPVTTQRKALLIAYKAAYESIPPNPQCPRCRLSLPKDQLERHHPAGRRKAAFLFTIQICSPCHKWVHQNGKNAEAIGLLWSGRNSKVFTLADANALVKLWPFPQTYPIDIYKQFSLTKT